MRQQLASERAEFIELEYDIRTNLLQSVEES
jgi:hypothetical protein